MIEWFIEIDKSLFLFLNGLHCSFFDTLMWWFSEKYFWIPLYLAVLLWWIKKYRWQAAWLVIFAILLLVASDQISVAIKFGVERLRPSHNPEFEGLVHHINNYKGGKYGFVSSHAANTFGFAVFSLLLIREKWFTIAILIWAAVVSYSRVYLGVHYPGDIFFGGLLGAALGSILWLPANQLQQHIKLSRKTKPDNR